jgi:hypothetical protein
MPGQYTSLTFGRALRAAGVVGSMGRVGDSVELAVSTSSTFDKGTRRAGVVARIWRKET